MLPGGDKEAAAAAIREEEESGGAGMSGEELIRLGRAWVALGEEQQGIPLINKVLRKRRRLPVAKPVTPVKPVMFRTFVRPPSDFTHE